MQIIKQFGINGDKRKLYNLTQNQDIRISEMRGQRVKVVAYVIYEQINQDGEPAQVFKAITEDGQIAGTLSKAFIQGVLDFLTCMETDDLGEFEVVEKVSKAGRKYIAFKA